MSFFTSRSVHSFRRSFRVGNDDVLHWFPGHMGKGLKQIESQLRTIDCVIEVHDARIPLSGRNPNFKHSVIGSKPHLLVLNKRDLADLTMKEKINEKLRMEHRISDVIYTNCKSHLCPGVTKVIPTAVELISKSERFNRESAPDFRIMVIGVPNVGKSSLINAIRNRHLNKASAAPVGAVAGVTRSLQTRMKVSDRPPIYILDTPGILTPSIPDVEVGMRLALCAALQDHLVGAEVISDYLLYWMNKSENFSYVEYMGLEGPTDNIGTVLTKGAMKLRKIRKIRSHDGYIERPNLTAAAEYFISKFREGKFGHVMLDSDYMES